MIAEMLLIGGRRSEQVFDKIYDLLLTAGQNSLLRSGVKNHVLDVLGKLNRPAQRADFGIQCKPLLRAQVIVEAPAPVVAHPVSSAPRRTPAQIKARKVERAKRDRAEREARRGSSQEKPLKQGGKKK